MNLKKLSVAMAIAAMCAMPAMAQKTQNNDKKGCEKSEQCARQGKDCAKARAAKASAFEGITLSDAQKAQLEALRPQRPEKADKAQRPDSAACANRKLLRKDYVKGVKNILTPDQYVVFLENIVVNDAQMPGGHHQAKMHHNKNKKGAKDFGKAKKQAKQDQKSK